MTQAISPVFSNKVLFVSLGAWTVAQVLKVLIGLVKEKRLNLAYLFIMGKMPSSHAAIVCALATAIALRDGLASPTFAISAILAVVVMYDAAGVRQAVSDNAILLNRVLDELLKGKPEFEKHARELIGHTRLEVLVGALIGIGMALLFM